MPRVRKSNRKLSYLKCRRCRLDKAKCLPTGRIWPGPRCVRCERFDYSCSKSCTKAEEALTSSPAQSSSTSESLPKKKTNSQLSLRELGDLGWLEECGTALYPYDKSADWRMVFKSLFYLKEEINDQASSQAENSLYLVQLLHNLDSPAEKRNSHPDVDSGRYCCHSSEVLATFYERNGNCYEAARVFSDILIFGIGGDVDPDYIERTIDRLLHMYQLFTERVSTTKKEGYSRAAAQKSILNLVARIDDHRLTSSLYREPWFDLDVFHSSVLFFAARYDACDLARFALDRGVDIEMRSYWGMTVLHLAVRFRSSQMVKFLLNEGAFVEAVDHLMQTPLIQAAESESLDQVVLLVLGGANLDAQDCDYCTPLMHASKKGSLEIVRLLLEKGAKVNAGDTSDVTALHLAATRRHFDILKLLLAFDADTTARDSSGNTALHAVARNLTGDGRDAVNCANALLKGELNSNVRNRFGETPLHFASYQCHQELVECLLEKAASPLAEADEGTPLHYAVNDFWQYHKDSGMLVVVASLLAHGAIADHARPLDGKTPLHMAARLSQLSNKWYGLKILQLLLRYGGDMYRLDESQLSAIDYVRQANPDAMSLRVYLPEHEIEVSNSEISLPVA